MPRIVRAVPRAPGAAGLEDGPCVPDALGNARASLHLIGDALLPALRRIGTEETR